MIHLIGLFIFLGSLDPNQVLQGLHPHVQNLDEKTTYAKVYVEPRSEESVRALKQMPGVIWWVRVGNEFLIFGREDQLQAMSIAWNLEFFEDAINPDGLVFVRCFGQWQLTDLPGRILARYGPVAVMDAPFLKNQSLEKKHRKQNAVVVIPFTPNTVLVGPAAEGVEKRSLPRADISELVAEVSATRWYSDVQTLAGFDRYTHNPGILDARDWIIAQFEALPGLDVSTQEFIVSSTLAYNVIAVLPGQARPDDWYIVGAHYDATAGSGSPSQPAPGADDNASGTAGVLEMARVFTSYPPESTILFICYSGEEQGLLGSVAHVNALQFSGDIAKVQDIVIMDMIGYSEDATLDCLLETRNIGLDLMNALDQAATTYTDLVIYTSLFAFGSDHVPYLNANLPAVLTIENDWNVYPYYHTVNDLPEHLVPDMAEEIIKMNVAAIADRAGLENGSASYGEYLAAWATMPVDPRFVDANGNSVIDITEILVFLD